jgi:hypothetical protein
LGHGFGVLQVERLFSIRNAADRLTGGIAVSSVVTLSLSKGQLR